jgi:hypothetical protein
MRRNELGRAAVLIGGVTLGSLVALLIRGGLRVSIAPPSGSTELRADRSAGQVPDPNREDVLERYRLAAAV